MVITQKITADGDIFSGTIDLSCTEGGLCNGVKVVITVPAGISINGPFVPESVGVLDVPVGSYNKTTNTWFLGTVTDLVTMTVNFIVDDITQADPIDGRFYIYFEIWIVMRQI